MQDSGAVARDIRNDITTLSWKMPRAMQETTGIDKSAIERLPLLSDISYTIDGIFNTAANMSHAVFSTVATSSVNRAIACVVNGATLGPVNTTLGGYDVKRSAKGELTWAVTALLADGVVPVWS